MNNTAAKPATPPRLKKGLRVKVYQKAVTSEDFEGVATLNKCEGTSDQSHYLYGESKPPRLLELWSVDFSTGPRVDRWVSVDDLTQEALS